MSYAPLDEHFDDNPKYTDLSLAHLGLLACAITYATRNLTDGVVPASWPGRRFGASGSQLARSLIAQGFWERRMDGSFLIVGFLDHNPSRDEVLSKRRAKSDAGRKGGLRTAQARGETKPLAPAGAPAGPLVSPLHFTARHCTEEREDPPTPKKEENASPLVERDGPRRLPRGIVNLEEQNWREAYAAAVGSTAGTGRWVFPPKQFRALLEVVEAHCVGDDRRDIQAWIDREVRGFVAAIQRLDENPDFWSGFGPDGLLRWRNAGCPGGGSTEPYAGIAEMRMGVRVNSVTGIPIDPADRVPGAGEGPYASFDGARDASAPGLASARPGASSNGSALPRIA